LPELRTALREGAADSWGHVQETTARADDEGVPAAIGRLPYFPALDGLRTLALGAVLLDHAGVAVVVGGHFGVTVFFVLSGFLVTALLLQEREGSGRIDVLAFWGRRARRLVPASLVFFGLTLLYLIVRPGRAPTTVVGDGLAALTWVANWRFVLTNRSYGDLFADPTPFAHVWSLAVEEQFYLVLPVAASLLLGRSARHALTRRLGVALTLVIAASTALLWSTYEPGHDPLRPYYGTDTRIAELAIGALLAVLLVRRGRLRTLSRTARAWTSFAAAPALAVVIACTLQLTTQDAGTYRGGLTAVAVATAVIVVACTDRTTWIARLLSLRPLPQLGRVSYGAYLFHWPLFLWVDERSMGYGGNKLLAVRLVLTWTLAFVSFQLVERPIRSVSIPRGLGPLAWANASIAVASVLVVVVSVAVPTDGRSSLFASGTTFDAPPLPEAPKAPAVVAPPVAPRPSSVAPSRATAAPAAEGAEALGGSAGREPARPAATPRSPAGPQSPPPAPTAASTTTTTQPADTLLRVAVVGDSLAYNLAEALARTSRSDILVYNLSVGGCPISRGGTRRFPDGTEFTIAAHCRWWDQPQNERTENLRAFDADIVLVEDALNEVVDRKLPDWPDYRAPGDPRLDAWLLNEYQAAAKVFSERGATVVFADAPCADWDRMDHWRSLTDGDRRVAALNRVYDNVVAATTKVAHLYERICPDHQFQDEVEGDEKGRPDGLHLSDLAADRLAERWLGPLLREVQRSRPPDL
jgi:peptidoglycan/LPS O-acetylase OafA/YrhL